MNCLKKFLFAIIPFILFSCVEDGEDVKFVYLNNTNNTIKTIAFGKSKIIKDTILLKPSQTFSHEKSETSGGVDKTPLVGLDSLKVIFSDSIIRFYCDTTSSKNPFDIEYFTGGLMNEKKHYKTFEYVYSFENQDFLKK